MNDSGYFQRCPLCEGQDTFYTTRGPTICPTCKGERIIHAVFGMTPTELRKHLGIKVKTDLKVVPPPPPTQGPA